MAEDDQVERRPADVERAEYRSIDPQMVIDGATALGVLAGGTGGLLAGLAKVKETSGGKEAPTEQSTKEE